MYDTVAVFARFLVPVTLLLIGGCGRGQELAPASLLDTAETHYLSGLGAFDRGDLWTAQAQFERARALDGDYPGAFVGEALVASSRGDYFQARQSIERALHADGDFVDAHIALGRVVAAEGQAHGQDVDKWLPAARRAFHRASQLAPTRPEPHYQQAQAEQQGGDLDAAMASYRRVVELNRGPLVARALAEIERLQSIQRTAPGTRLGVRIALQSAVTRAELAVLLLEELRLEDLVQQRRLPVAGQSAFAPPAPPTVEPAAVDPELRAAWARPWIERVLALGISGFEPLPDGSFGGGESVTRAQYARVVEGILVLLTADADLPTRYIGEASRFADVRDDHFAYNAIALSVDRGIMSPDRVTGLFRPEDPISGAEALVIIRDLQNAVRMEF